MGLIDEQTEIFASPNHDYPLGMHLHSSRNFYMDPTSTSKKNNPSKTSLTPHDLGITTTLNLVDTECEIGDGRVPNVGWHCKTNDT